MQYLKKKYINILRNHSNKKRWNYEWTDIETAGFDPNE